MYEGGKTDTIEVIVKNNQIIANLLFDENLSSNGNKRTVKNSTIVEGIRNKLNANTINLKIDGGNVGDNNA